MSKFPKPYSAAMIFEDHKLYACLANNPIVRGHVVVVWKKKTKDLSLLSKKDYGHLMSVVDAVRSAMLKALRIKKVYLVYMDEINQVHWHLVPRYHKKGYKVFMDMPKKLKDFALDDVIQKYLKI